LTSQLASGITFLNYWLFSTLTIGLAQEATVLASFLQSAKVEPADGVYGQILLITEPTLNSQTDGASPLLFGLRLFEYVDCAIMKRWLDMCKGSHSGKCNAVHRTSAVEDLAIRVVEVEKQCVTSINLSSQYIALSYVWVGTRLHN
jgi:hypothetical protein